VDGLSQTAGGRAAVSDNGAHTTYAELSERSMHAAAALKRLGVGPGDAVALLAPNGLDWLVVAIAVMRRGAALHAFNTWLRPAELDYLLRAARPKVLVTIDKFATTDFVDTIVDLVPEVGSHQPDELASSSYPSLQRIVVLGSTDLPGMLSWSDALADAGPDPERDLSEPSLASVIVYTSGSTRAPKAVPLVQRAMIDNGFAIGERMQLTDADRVWLASPLFWSYGIANATMATFTHGATLVLEQKFDAQSAAATFQREHCTAAYLLPTMVDALCEEAAAEVSAVTSLRTGLTIGRPDEVRRVVEELGIDGICNVYGSTEVYGNCCVTDTADPLDVRLATQGQPLPGVELRIVDEAGAVLPTGQPGQIEVRGRVMPGYLPGPDDEIESPFADGGWFRTGDTGILRDDGRIRFVGRHSEMIKTAGINVSPAEIEAVLRTFPDILEVAVVGVAEKVRGEVPVAFVVTSASVDEAQVTARCRELMSSYKVPRRVYRVETLPLTATGKLARKSLVEMAARMERDA
jgi:fatty-acyl-CoA synthase